MDFIKSIRKIEEQQIKVKEKEQQLKVIGVFRKKIEDEIRLDRVTRKTQWKEFLMNYKE